MIAKDAPVLDLSGADLRKADLYVINLEGANLSGADLRKAGLVMAFLEEGADLSKTDLREANLGGARLNGANLVFTNLENAKGITEEQLATCKNLERATMPNGQKYEDWLKNKGRRADGRPPGLPST